MDRLFKDQQWYQIVLDSLPLGIVSVDQDRRITYMNPHAEQLTGWEEAESLGRFCGDVLKGGQCNRECPLRSVLAKGESSVSMRSTITNRQGETIPVHFHTVGLFDKSGSLLGAVEAFFDISQRVSLEEERDRTLSFFAHDMKSPLVSAAGFMNRLLTGKAGELNQKQLDYLNVILAQLKHVQSLVIDYLDVVRLGTKQVQLALGPMDMSQCLSELAETYGARARDKGLSWSFQVQGELPLIQGDANRLLRVFSNLLDNAIKFSSQGEVEFTCGVGKKGHIYIRVCDQGPGLSDKDMESLFTPFYRGSAAQGVEGTGLGLAAVKAIVLAHGGQIMAANRPHGGACFEVILPGDNQVASS